MFSNITRLSYLKHIGQPYRQKNLLGCFSKRSMILHEYQATQLVNKYHVPIPLGQVAFNEKEAFAVARKFGADYNRKFVVKA